MKYSIAIAGSTKNTLQVAETLFKDPRFIISIIITPEPRKVGREKNHVQNPLHAFADRNKLPTVLVDKKFGSKIQGEIKKKLAKKSLDFLLVVDFGFLVPKWLLDLPKIAPLNIHPSKLPRWRGASPGQYVLLNGENESAVTLMVMNETMDLGPIIAQLAFKVEPNWTQIDYYQHSFNLICSGLGDLIEQFAQGRLIARKQLKESPTPVTNRLSKEDSFRTWTVIKQAMTTGNQAQELERACRAYFPWPKLWTFVQTERGKKRLIILSCHLNENSRLVLDQVYLEGKIPAKWNEVKNTVINK